MSVTDVCCLFCDPLAVNRAKLKYAKCEECGLCLCGDCFQFHFESCKKVKVLTLHICKDHNAFVNGFCFSCNAVVCKDCRVQSHELCQPNVVTLQSAFKDIKQVMINDYVEKIERLTTNIGSTLDFLLDEKTTSRKEEGCDENMETQCLGGDKYDVLDNGNNGTTALLADFKVLKCQLDDAISNLEHIREEKNPIFFVRKWKNPKGITTSVNESLDLYQKRQTEGDKWTLQLDGNGTTRTSSNEADEKSTWNIDSVIRISNTNDNEANTRSTGTQIDGILDESFEYENKYMLQVTDCLPELMSTLDKLRLPCDTIRLPRRENKTVDTFTDRIELIYNYIIKMKNKMLKLEEELGWKETEIQLYKEHSQSRGFFSSILWSKESSVDNMTDILIKQVKDAKKAKSYLVNTLIDKEYSLEKTKQEKEELQTRLSTLAGEQLTKGNPAITDLSDPNRPMKIGEKYGELYDNEWTDGMELANEVTHLLPNFDHDEVVVQHLCKLIIECYRECKNISTNQLEAFGYTSGIVDKSGSEFLDVKPIEVCDEVGIGISKSDFHKTRRVRSAFFAEWLFKNKRLCGGIEQAYQNWDYPVKDVQLMHKLMDTPYFEKCILLCWYMVIQDPMMYLEEDLEKDSIFDRTTYKEFVQKGDRVKFVVWPALYLYKGGPLLYKGVVQAYSQ